MGALFAALLTAMVQDVGPALPPFPAAVEEKAPEAAPAVAPVVQQPEPAPAPAPKLIPPEDPRPIPRKLVDRPESGPSLGGFIGGSLVVMALLVGTFVLLKRFGRGSRFLAGSPAINVIARKPLGPRQDVFLVEVGTRVFLIGSTKEQMSTLGEFANPDEVAVLRSNLPGRKDDSMKLSFRESLRDGIREEESPEPEGNRLVDSIAGELAEIRKTVRAWRA